ATCAASRAHVTRTPSPYAPGAAFVRTAPAGGAAAAYPSDNFFPASLDLVGFLNLAGGDYHLAPSSPYKNTATDGRDLGADIDALTAATASALSGVSSATPSLAVTPRSPPTLDPSQSAPRPIAPSP